MVIGCEVVVVEPVVVVVVVVEEVVVVVLVVVVAGLALLIDQSEARPATGSTTSILTLLFTA